MNEPWLPVMMTEPLSENFTSDGDRLIALADKVFKFEENPDAKLEEWQKWLIRRVLETYPPDWPVVALRGRLRYRQVVISLARQNGKSVLASVFGLYGLLLQVKNAPKVISLASTVEQAKIIFNKVRYVVENEPMLSKRFKTTTYRGIRSKNVAKPAEYQVKAGNGKGLQGASVNMCLFDELHISREDAYDAMVLGGSAQESSLILGITTAGDDNSELLKRLYETGKAAVRQDENHDPEFGFFLWEAPEHLDIYDPEAIKAANPSIASGRLDVDRAIMDMRGMPEHEARRYRLNQFVSAENVWMPMNKWYAVKGEGINKAAKVRDVVFAVDRSPGWEYASIVAAIKNEDGIVETEVIATYNTPDLETLERDCIYLHKTYKGRFYVDANVLKDLHTKLRERSIEVEFLTSNQMMNATATVYQMVHEQRLNHPADPIVMKQLPRTVTENVGDGHKVSRKKSSGPVESVIATIMAVYGAEIQRPKGPSLFIRK